MKKYLSLSCCMAALAGATVSHAETAAPPPNAPPQAEAGDIIVTAQKRSQSLQSTPMSISAVTGEELTAKAKNTVEDALRDVPGVQIQGIAQGAQIFIRGVGSAIDPSYADPAIALMADGVYTGRTESVAGGTFDIERVEVLRGPQGTLYGRNASGGVVNVITNSPKLGVFEGVIRGQAGNYDLWRGEGAINVPLGDMVALRAAGFREKRDSYIDNGGMDSDKWGARVKLLAEPASWLRLTGKFDYYHANELGPNTVPVPGSAGKLTFPPPIFFTNFNPTLSPPFTGGVPIQRFPNGWQQKDPGDPWSNNPEHAPGRAVSTSTTYQLQADADLGFASLTLLPAYSKQKNKLTSSLLFGTLAGAYRVSSGNTSYKSIEARLASPASSPVNWIVGAYYLYTQGTPAFAQQSVGGFQLNLDYQPSKTTAAFGQITYPITDSFRLTGGLRWSKDEQGSSFVIVSTDPANPYNSGTLSFSNSAEAVTYKAGIEYDLAPRSLLYAHVATGFKQGGLSPNVPPQPFKPEKLRSYEIGVKNRFFDNALQLNASAFYYDYKNYQLSYLQTVPLGPTGATYDAVVVTNAETSKIYGAELAMNWQVTQQDTVRAALNYLHAEYGKVVLPNNPFVNQGLFDLDGRQIANSPDWVATLGYEHRWDIGAGQLTASVDSRLSTKYFATAEEYLPGALQKGYTRTDAFLRYSAPDDRWSLTGWVKNIENKAQTTFVLPAYRRLVTPPRTFGVTAEAKF